MAIIHNYAEIGTGIKFVDLPNDALLCVGRIIRAVAEIEDVITVYLSSLANLSDGHAIILFGRDGLTKKIDLTRRFARAHGGDELERFKLHLENDALQNVVEMRNVLAHGIYLGRADDNRWAFRTVKQLELRPTEIEIEAVTFGDADFEHCAATAEKLIRILELELKVKSARELRRAEQLAPHTKANFPNQSK